MRPHRDRTRKRPALAAGRPHLRDDTKLPKQGVRGESTCHDGGCRGIGAPDLTDRKLAGFIAYGPPLSDDQRDWLDEVGHDQLVAADERGLLVGALLVRVCRLEREAAERAA